MKCLMFVARGPVIYNKIISPVLGTMYESQGCGYVLGIFLV